MASIYADVHVPFAVINCLRGLGADVLRVQDDERRQDPDPKLLLRAVELGRLLLTCDQDFVRIGREWQKDLRPFPGIAWIKSDDADPRTVAECVLMLLRCGEPEEVENGVHFVPF